MNWITVLVHVVAFAVAFGISTSLIRRGIPQLKSDGQPANLPDKTSDDLFDLGATGFWIGLCETFLIFALVHADELGALAIIIGAKEFVRKEKIAENPSFYLLGTLANLCVALLFALLAGTLSEAWQPKIDAPLPGE